MQVTFHIHKRIGGCSVGSCPVAFPPCCSATEGPPPSKTSALPPREAPLRSSSSPPNSTGSTVDSDGWDVAGPASKSRKSFTGFKRPRGEELEPQKRPKSSGVLLRGSKKADKVKKKKKKKLGKMKGDESSSFLLFPHSGGAELPGLGRAIKEEPEDYLSAGEQAPSCADETHPVRSGPVCKEEPEEERGCWESESRQDSVEGGVAPQGEAVVMKLEGLPGTRTVIRLGKQVVFRDEDGSADDEDIMVDSDDDSWDLVTCFCMKPFAGRAMIECNQCNTWVHLSCAKIRKSNVPETYTCQRCKDSKFDIRRSNRSRMGSRKHLLD
ncbi:PHD finger protein 13 isoform X2 [Brachyhypopomus gauderio]|uniref:PHD finger protein 13 isoform X2 n=1 Tax=Brachyhypopomus gauderio TaxID=698409 RepID=UPI0040410448